MSSKKVVKKQFLTKKIRQKKSSKKVVKKSRQKKSAKRIDKSSLVKVSLNISIVTNRLRVTVGSHMA